MRQLERRSEETIVAPLYPAMAAPDYDEGRLIGYARVSTADQTSRQQVIALKRMGCSEVYEDISSGSSMKRSDLKRMLDNLSDGDTLVVWKLDRLARSLRDLLTMLDELERRGIKFRSMTENIDTSTAPGRMLMQMVGSFAEFERAMLVERTRSGLDRARSEGKKLGRKRSLSARQQRDAVQRVESGQSNQADIARLYGVSKATISRMFARVEKEKGGLKSTSGDLSSADLA